MEVRKNGIWGTICNDNTDENNWSGSLDFGSGVSATQAVDDRAAEVICRQMGWTVGRAQQDASNQIWMDNLNCPDWPSDKTHVEQCEHNNKDDWQWGTNDCFHTQDIGVGCDAQTEDSKAGV